jgi:hypothetical protein
MEPFYRAKLLMLGTPAALKELQEYDNSPAGKVEAEKLGWWRKQQARNKVAMRSRLSGERKRERPDPLTPLEYFGKNGRMSGLEYRAAARAADIARRCVREKWLPILTRWMREEIDEGVKAELRQDISKLRRVLGKKPLLSEKRRQTRERVRKFRAKARETTGDSSL